MLHLIGREAVQIAVAASRDEVRLRATARRMRRVPRRARCAATHPIGVAQLRRTGAVGGRRPVGAGGVAGAASVPSACEPVRMSCWFGVSPTPFTTVPFSVSAVSFLRLLLSEWRSSTLFAMTTPFAFVHGPLPIRSFAFTAGCPAAAAALRYARQVRLPAPAAAARVWQILSAPARPPRFAPLPDPALVTKNDI